MKPMRDYLKDESDINIKLPRRIRSDIFSKVIFVDDVCLYRNDGRSAVKYNEIILDLEPVKNDGRYCSQEEYLQFSQTGWIDYFKLRENNITLPSLPVYYAVIERLQEENNSSVCDLQAALRRCLCTNTRIDYINNRVIHGHGCSVNAAIPDTEGIIRLDEVKDNKDWRSALQALLMPKDLDKALAILREFSKSPLRIMTPDAVGRTRITGKSKHGNITERAVSLELCCGNFTIDMGLRPDKGHCHSLEMTIY